MLKYSIFFQGGDKEGGDPRVQKERLTRTLFVRNVDYQTGETFLRGMFEKFGEIKRFFDLIEKRGMAFVTYVSISCFQLFLVMQVELKINFIVRKVRENSINEIQLHLDNVSESWISF